MIFKTFLFIILFIVFACSKPSHISLQNGYNNIVIALPADANSEDRIRMVQSVKDLFEYSSRVLYVATKRRSTFKNVIMLVPKSWDIPETWLSSDEVKRTAVLENNGGFPSYLDADIVITRNSRERKRLLTLQDEGCGQIGVRIYVPEEFLMSSMSLKSKSIEFIHHWAQYRYGIFAEGGFQYDSRYPQYYSIPGISEVKITACTNVPLSYNITSISGDESCKLQTSELNGKPSNPECSPVPLTNNELLISSIMYQQALPHVFRFCDGEHGIELRHNPASPSKHNILCSEEGTWLVALRSQDFVFGNNPATKYKPENVSFQFVQESKVRVVIAVDVSVSMAENERYHLIKNAISKFILIDLPLESEIGLIFFDDDVKSSLKLFLLATEDEKIAFFESAPFYEEANFRSNASCISCAIEISLEVLRNSSSGMQDGIVVLITHDAHELSESSPLQDDLKSDGTKLFAILFGGANSKNFNQLVFSSGGSLMQVTEGSQLQTLSLLYLSFSQILAGTTFWGENSISLVKEIPTNEMGVVIDFDVDSSIVGDLKLLVSGPDFNIIDSVLDIENTTLTLPSSEKALLQKQDFIPAWLYRIKQAEVGKYIFEAKKKTQRESDLLVLISGTPANKLSDAITLRIWTNFQDSKKTLPLKMFAEVKYGIHPIINSKVDVTVYDFNGAVISTFKLLDNGLGDPDITKNDGIYSRYFFGNYSNAGYYTAVIHASDNKSQILYVSNDHCCGSFFPAAKTAVTGPFTRLAGPLTFWLSEMEAYNITPNRILDLQIAKFDQEQGECVLQWTAAGESFDHGTALSYELKLFKDRMSAKRRFEKTGIMLEYNREITHYLQPIEYGGRLEYTVKWPDTLETGYYFFAVRAVNNDAIKSDVSNVVEVFLKARIRNETIFCEETNTASNSYLKYNVLLFCVILGISSNL